MYDKSDRVWTVIIFNSVKYFLTETPQSNLIYNVGNLLSQTTNIEIDMVKLHTY